MLAAAESGARVWDATTGEAIMPPLAHSGLVRQLLFSPDGSRVLILGPRNVLEVYDATTRAAVSNHALAAEPPAFGLVPTPDGRAAIAPRRLLEGIDVRDTWPGLRTSYPQDFAPAP